MGGRGRGGRLGTRGGPIMSGGQRKRAEMGERAREALAEVRRHLQAGEHPAAAGLLGDIASRAAGRGESRIAAHLQLRAAHALLDAGDADGGLAAGGVAVEFAAVHPDRRSIARKLARLVGRMRDLGHASAADALESRAREALGLQKPWHPPAAPG